MARTYGELDALVGDLPSPAAPTSPRRVTLAGLRPVLPWLVGFVAYQLINPGLVGWWARIWTAVRDAIG